MTVPLENMDVKAHLEKRRRNNAAAKKSRDAKREKDIETATRAAFLEQENVALRSLLLRAAYQRAARTQRSQKNARRIVPKATSTH